MIPLIIGLILLVILLLSREATKTTEENLQKPVAKKSPIRGVKFSDKVRVREFGERTGEYIDKLNDSALI